MIGNFCLHLKNYHYLNKISSLYYSAEIDIIDKEYQWYAIFYSAYDLCPCHEKLHISFLHVAKDLIFFL